MNRAVGIALLVVGVVLIIFGMNAAESLGSRLSQLFTGTPSDKAIWLLLVKHQGGCHWKTPFSPE
jgi:Protein of unknown function (DUF3185)